MEPQTNSATAKIVSALIIGLIVGFVAGAFWQERRLSNELPSGGVAAGDEGPVMPEKKMELKQGAAATGSIQPSPMVKESKAEPQAMSAAGVPTASLLVEDQTAGASVEVAQVVTSEPVWVAVREEKDGKLGNILGVRRIHAGTNTAVVVELLRPTISGASYAVVLHNDAGDAAFNYREDVVVDGVKGRFTAR